MVGHRWDLGWALWLSVMGHRLIVIIGTHHRKDWVDMVRPQTCGESTSQHTCSGLFRCVLPKNVCWFQHGFGSKKSNYSTSSDPRRGILFDIISGILSDILSGILCGILSDILSGILSDIYSDILSDILLWNSFWHSFRHSIWHLFWHTFWHSIVKFFLTFFLAFYLASILTYFLTFYCEIIFDILSGILSGIYSDIPSGILSGIQVQACPTASGAGNMVSGAHSTVQKEDRSDGSKWRKEGRRSCTFVKI